MTNPEEKNVRTRNFLAAFLGFLVITCFTVTAAEKNAGVPDKELMQKIMDAWSSLDASKPAAYYSKNADNVYFDIAPLKYQAWDQYQKGAAQVLALYSSLKLTVENDARVHREGNLTWATATFHLDGIHKDTNVKDDMDGRWTVVWKKEGGKWLIVHEHVSMPLGGGD